MSTSPWVAAFPMYMRPELVPAFDALWLCLRQALRERGIDAPDKLTDAGTDLLGFWSRPDLLISQTCGYPYRHFLKERVRLVGTPDFGLPGCEPGYYHSAFVVRRDDPRQSLSAFDGAVFAYNDLHSQSGYAAPMIAARRAGVRFLGKRQSGAHVASAQMVLHGQADIAGLDAISWRHMEQFDDWASDLRVLAWTEPTPGLPFITAAAALTQDISNSLREAIRFMPMDLRNLLTLKDIVNIDEDHYVAVADCSADP